MYTKIQPFDLEVLLLTGKQDIPLIRMIMGDEAVNICKLLVYGIYV